MDKTKVPYNEIWLDFLCWESFISILFSDKISANAKIYYCQISKCYQPVIRVVQLLTKKSFIQIQDFVFSSERINNVSAYEMVHDKMEKLLNNYGNALLQNNYINDFADKNSFNILKVIEHIKEASFYYFYRPVELLMMSKIRSKELNVGLMVKRTHFSGVLKQEFENVAIFFYRTWFSDCLPIINRENYYYDKRILNEYFLCNLKNIFCMVIRWSEELIKVVFVFIYQLRKGKLLINTSPNIAVEQLQSRIRFDQVNDVYWFNGSSIDPGSVYSFTRARLDPESEKNLSKLGIKQICFLPPLNIFKELFNANTSNIVYVSAGFLYVFAYLNNFVTFFKNIFRDNEYGWLSVQLVSFKSKVLYWKSIYEQLNIKIFWTMVDEDMDKLAKAQALEILDGIFTGSHWSNFPFVSCVNQKCYDLFFVWGKHFKDNIFNKYPYLGVCIVGYPSDYYFNEYSEQAKALKAKYKGEFILSYQDNAMFNDIIYSIDMQINMHKMLLSLLRDNDNVILFLKPKRKYVFEKVIEEVPQLIDFISNDRIVTFLGDTVDTKSVPALVGMASDLVVGLGISTAAAECYFAGTVAYHVDQTGFMKNEFANHGLDKIVFRDIESLKNAIQDRIDRKNILSHGDYWEYYEMLDPFQDGKAYQRTGFVIKKLQEVFEQGLSRNDAVKRVVSEYNCFLKKNRTYSSLEAIEQCMI